MQLLSNIQAHIFPLPERFELQVGYLDYKLGIKGSCTDCAIARAACRALGIPRIGLITVSAAGIKLWATPPCDEKPNSFGIIQDPIKHWEDPGLAFSFEDLMHRFDMNRIDPESEPVHIFEMRNADV